MKKIVLFTSLILAVVSVAAKAPLGYYHSANAKNGAELKTALYSIIAPHTQRTYSQLWTDFQTTDKRSDGTVWDMYSNCTFAFATNQCGNYKAVCDCYNREHSFPKSWFGGDVYPMYTDLFHMYPTDGYVNNRRGNLPFGEVGAASWTNAKATGTVGTAKSELGYSGNVYEPDDEYKGDFARTYFYMVTCYEDQVAACVANEEAKPMLNGTAYPALTLWAQEMLLRWHRNDPVSEKELARNEVVYGIQNNRNPYIDYPELVEHIWGNSKGGVWHYTDTVVSIDTLVLHAAKTGMNTTFTVYPNPASATLNICIEDGSTLLQADLLNTSGMVVLSEKSGAAVISVANIKAGAYLLRAVTSKGVGVRKVAIKH